jgi:hypothetical protein
VQLRGLPAEHPQPTHGPLWLVSHLYVFLGRCFTSGRVGLYTIEGQPSFSHSSGSSRLSLVSPSPTPTPSRLFLSFHLANFFDILHPMPPSKSLGVNTIGAQATRLGCPAPALRVTSTSPAQYGSWTCVVSGGVFGDCEQRESIYATVSRWELRYFARLQFPCHQARNASFASLLKGVCES